MSSRDLTFLKAHCLLLVALFAGLLLRPGSIPGNFGDIYSYHYPLRHLAASTVQQGRLPLWNPYIFGGMPLEANPQAVVFFPLSLLHYALPLSWAFSWDAFLNVWLAGLGAMLLARRHRLDPAGAWTLALAYGLSPFLLCRTSQGVPTHLAALAWCPWIWLLADARAPVWFALTLALQVLSGHPQFAILNLAAVALAAALRRPSLLPKLFAGGLAAAALASVQALPTLEFLRHSVRTVWSPEFSLGYSLKPSYLLTLVHPRAFGDPLRGDLAPNLYPSEFFEMLRLYIGLAPLCLAAVGLAVSRLPWALAAAGLFFATGSHNPAYRAVRSALGLGFLRVPARFSLLVLWGAWLAAGTGWRALRSTPARRAALAGLTALDLAFWAAGWVYRQDPARYVRADPELASVLRAPLGRMATSPEIPFADKAMLYRIPNATGYEAFYLAPIAFYTSRSERGPAADGSRTYIRRWETPEMRRLGVRWFISAGAVPGARPAVVEGNTYLYESRAAGPLSGDALAAGRPSPESWRLRVRRGEPFFVSEAAYPGWRAWVDGREAPMATADDLFLSVSPPPSAGPGPESEARLVFMPDSFRAGLLVTLAALALAAVLGARGALAGAP